MTQLTSEQEAFARAYVEIGNARQAYAMAGYSQSNSLTMQQNSGARWSRAVVTVGLGRENDDAGGQSGAAKT